jgi:hypothetical protein
MRALMVDSTGLAKALRQGPYRNPALVPASPWLDNQPPAKPQLDVTVINDTLQLKWQHSNASDVFRWVVYFKYDDHWQYVIKNQSDRNLSLAQSRTVSVKKRGTGESQEIVQKLNAIALSAVDRTGNESKLVQRQFK